MSTFNGLYLIAWILKLLTKQDPEDNLNLGELFPDENRLVTFIGYLTSNIIDIETSNTTYHVLLESTIILLTLLMHTNVQIQSSNSLITAILNRFIKQQPAPVFPFEQASGLGFALASGVWSVMTVG